jgi:aspartyl-tRNA(Asn)/glutamyl-tRNA(Gln) amidotransferase subunit C
MPITEADIEKIAQLAHLDITDDERKMFAPQISEIVTYVEQLNAIDTSAVEPALGGLTAEGEQTESSRADEAQSSLGQKLALDQAPDPASGYFRVPKVLG